MAIAFEHDIVLLGPLELNESELGLLPHQAIAGLRVADVTRPLVISGCVRRIRERLIPHFEDALFRIEEHRPIGDMLSLPRLRRHEHGIPIGLCRLVEGERHILRTFEEARIQGQEGSISNLQDLFGARGIAGEARECKQRQPEAEEPPKSGHVPVLLRSERGRAVCSPPRRQAQKSSFMPNWICLPGKALETMPVVGDGKSVSGGRKFG